jgi:hypothetical protein
MDKLIVVFVPSSNKKEDPVVVTWKLSIKNNVILLLNVELLGLAKNEIHNII